jgi:hypothetical protein
MARFEGQKLIGETITLDGHGYVECEFVSCRLIYGGGEVPKLQHCNFACCQWQLDEAARRTIQFLRGIYHSGPGGREWSRRRSRAFGRALARRGNPLAE